MYLCNFKLNVEIDNDFKQQMYINSEF